MQHNQHIAELGPLLSGKGIRHVVICPGSRNAPLIQLFTTDPSFSCHSIVDERSASYVALGMARQMGETVAVVTTSGTAVLNLAPAVAEAFYQQVPLLVLTADRPLEVIPRFNNQWMDQEAPFYSFSKGFYQLPAEVAHPEDLERIMGHVDQLAAEAGEAPAGPVHLNAILEEPLYEMLPRPTLEHTRGKGSDIRGSEEKGHPESTPLAGFSGDMDLLVLAGMSAPDDRLLQSLTRLVSCRQTTVIAENISNLDNPRFVAYPELVLAAAREQERPGLIPGKVVSFGGQVVSKRLKIFLQSIPGLEHMEVRGDVVSFLDQLAETPGDKGGFQNRYQALWKEVEQRGIEAAREKLKAVPFSNLMAAGKIMQRVPAGTTVHLGNSSAIRYSQLLPCNPGLKYYSNRGTSGIDGTLSTAVGAAMVDSGMHLLVVGDLGFVYDSNALWNKDFPDNLRIVVLNDGGGGIFRLLEGPGDTAYSEEFQITRHPVSLELLSQSFGRAFQRVDSSDRLEEMLALLFDPGHNLAILEVDTSSCENSRIFKDFLKINPSA